MKLDRIQQKIHDKRVLCSDLCDEISYLTSNVLNHMSAHVEVEHLQKLVLEDIQLLLNSFNITLDSS